MIWFFEFHNRDAARTDAGVAFIEATSALGAATKASKLGINPGRDVDAVISLCTKPIPPRFHNRLLTDESFS